MSLTDGDFDMKYSPEQTNGRSVMVDPLSNICLNRSDRKRALTDLRKADRITDTVFRTVAAIRAAVAGWGAVSRK